MVTLDAHCLGCYVRGAESDGDVLHSEKIM